MKNLTSNKVWLVIPAAGIGQRMQSATPKQYIKIHNKTILEHTLGCFLDHEMVAGIVVVIASHDKYWDSLLIKNNDKPLFAVEGGSDRAGSVFNGLNYLSNVQQVPVESWVMVHDAARPCLSKTDLESLLGLCDMDCVGGLLASPVRDTMKRSIVSENRVIVSSTEPRENLWHAQTPQMFRLDKLKFAIEKCRELGVDITDECSAIEYVGEAPVIVESVHNNIKVTSPNDLDLVSFLLDTNELKGKKTSG